MLPQNWGLGGGSAGILPIALLFFIENVRQCRTNWVGRIGWRDSRSESLWAKQLSMKLDADTTGIP
jgi:hypothetical protein